MNYVNGDLLWKSYNSASFNSEIKIEGDKIILIDYENVLITPHLAGFSQEAYTKSHAFAVRNSLKVSSGEAPDSVVLPDD